MQPGMSEIRKKHRQNIIMGIIRSQRYASKFCIQRISKFSMSTITSTIDELLEANLIIQSGIGRSTGGRRPTYYSINPDGGYFIGIEFSATAIHASLLNLDREAIQTYSEVQTQSAQTIAPRLLEISDFLISTLKNPSLLLGIGIGAPGLVDSKNGRLIYYAHIPHFKGIELKNAFEAHFSVPVFVDNNVNMLALAYKSLPDNIDLSNFVIIAIRTGIGMSCVLENRLYRGVTNTAGEIGHLRVYPSTALCECGHIGCLEAEASNRALLKKINSSSEYDYLHEYSNSSNGEFGLREFIDSAIAGHEKSLNLLREACDYLSLAIVQLVNILNPKCIIITGELTACGDVMLDMIKQKVLSESFPYNAENLNLSLWSGSPNSASIGAGIFAESMIFAPVDIADIVFSGKDDMTLPSLR